MPRFLLPLVLIALTAACVPVAPPPPAETAPSASPQPPERPTEAPGAAAPLPLPPPDPPMLAQQRAACAREGGTLSARGQGLYSCVRPTRDGGRACTAASDCEGLCLARSGSCAPITPIYGCQEIFTAPGRRETLCTE